MSPDVGVVLRKGPLYLLVWGLPGTSRYVGRDTPRPEHRWPHSSETSSYSSPRLGNIWACLPSYSMRHWPLLDTVEKRERDSTDVSLCRRPSPLPNAWIWGKDDLLLWYLYNLYLRICSHGNMGKYFSWHHHAKGHKQTPRTRQSAAGNDFLTLLMCKHLHFAGGGIPRTYVLIRRDYLLSGGASIRTLGPLWDNCIDHHIIIFSLLLYTWR